MGKLIEAGLFAFEAGAVRAAVGLGCLFLLLPGRPAAQETQPLVAIHDSELTRALETTNSPAVPPVPNGPGTTGRQWWPTNWPYFLLPESVKEALRADGTAFAVVSDADIASNALLVNGKPRYPILISLAAEAVADDQIAPLTNYVAAGGFLLVGSSAFTRYPDGSTRSNFAFATELGLNMATPGFTNWDQVLAFNKQIEHRLVSHYPSGSLSNRMPVSSEEINWGVTPSHRFMNAHPAWRVQATDATVLATSETSPYLAVKPFGSGCFIYHAAFQPLVGHGGFAPSMYAYVIFRRAIEWAFESVRLPVFKLSPWPYAYDAAFTVRHDLENYTNLIAKIEQSAQFEYTNGAKGDYYFCTGTLREDAASAYDTNAMIAGLRRAVTNFGASIYAHNGGLVNPRNPALPRGVYDYWHWGPDEALDVIPTNYTSGKEYAFISLSNAFMDMDFWLEGLDTGPRGWVSCYFNATREHSLEILDQLDVRTAGDQKLTPFPHWTLSTQVPGKRYSFLSLPVSDWFIVSGAGGQVAQSLEPWRNPYSYNLNTLREAIDFYYRLGALINIYSHTLSTGEGDAGQLVPEYIRYGLDTNLHPRVWSANATLIYQWALGRSNAQITVAHSTNGLIQIADFQIAGATDPDTAVELVFPGGGELASLTVLTNGSLADPAAYRLKDHSIKIHAGATTTNAQVQYELMPRANPDAYQTLSGRILNVAAPGVLTNDLPGLGDSLAAILLSGPTNGTFTLNSNGGFTYEPAPGFVGVDSFTYQAHDGVTNSRVAAATLLVTKTDLLFFDNFTRPTEPGTLAPWKVQSGNWLITEGVMQAGTNPVQTYGYAYVTNSWSNGVVEVRLRFPSGAFGGGVGVRLNPETGAHYAAWVYPEDSPAGSRTLRLVKFQTWTTFGYQGTNGLAMAETPLPSVGTNWNTLKLALHTNQLAVYFNDQQVLSTVDAEVGPYLSGGVSLDFWTADIPYPFWLDEILVSPLAADESYLVDVNRMLDVGAPGVLENDTAVYGTNLTAILLSSPTNGLLTLQTNGAFTYQPLENLAPSHDSFTYAVYDGPVLLGSAQTLVTLLASNHPPLLPAQSDLSVPELTQLVITNTAEGVDVAGDRISYQLLSAPPGMQIDSNGVILWNPDEFDGPGLYTITTAASDNGAPPATATNSFTLEILEVNTKPALPDLPVVVTDELTLLVLTNTATDPDWPPNALAYSLVSAPPGLGISTNGVLTWTPNEMDGPGTNTFTVMVTDDGTPPLSASNSITVIVRDVNSPPQFTPQPDLTTPESVTLWVTNSATDTDWPSNQLTFILANAPSNATLSAGGVVEWTPDESQGPSTNLFVVIVEDDGEPRFRATNSYFVVVSEVNSAPALPSQTNRVLRVSTLLMVTNAATDPDVPANLLTYALAEGPAQASISTNGIIQWIPSPAQQGTTNLFVTVVTDNGVPSLGATNSFEVVVYSTPTIALDGVALAAETCLPTNGVIDPGETVTVMVSLKNTGLVDASQVVATLLATNGVLMPSQPQEFGTLLSGGAAVSRPFSFLANGPCGGQINLTFQVEDVVSTLAPVSAPLGLGATATVLAQNFDTATPPALPEGWTTTASGYLSNWITSTSTPDTLPYAAFSAGATNIGINELVSPLISLPAGKAQLQFRHSFDLEAQSGAVGYDGGVLEISIGTNAFVDLLTAGGTFLAGGYNRTIHTGYGSALAGRPAWSGNSGGWVTVIAEFPLAAANQQIQLRWLCATDLGVSRTGWYVDSIQISAPECCVNAPPELPSQQDRTVPELLPFWITNTVTTPGLPAAPVAYSLENPPAGALIDTNGVISWTPSEAQGPGDYTLVTIAANSLVSNLRATNSVNVSVLEVNSAPTLPSLPDLTVTQLGPLTITNTANDEDLPANPLTYTLLSAPPGAEITAEGIIRWTPWLADSPSTNLFTTVVWDNAGPPALSATNAFLVLVPSGAQLPEKPLIQFITVTNGVAVVTWTSIPGCHYCLQSSDDLLGSKWTNVGPHILATGESTSASDAVGSAGQRVYRVILLP